MTRILVLDDSDRRFSELAELAGAAGYELVQAESRKRLVLEMRAAPAGVIVACADFLNGHGLEVVGDAYAELESPLPVLVFSSKCKPDELLESIPRNLLLGALVAPEPSPSALLEALLQVSPPEDLALARQVLFEAQGELAGEQVAIEDGQRDLAVGDPGRLLAAMHRSEWSGMLEVRGVEAGTLLCEVREGALASIRSDGGGDLVETARLEGRLDGITLPPVKLADSEEEVGLLMAMRALGPHEVPKLRKQTRGRLIEMLLEAASVSAHVDSQIEPSAGETVPILPVLLVAEDAGPGDEAGLPGSRLSASLPRGSYRGLTDITAEVVKSLLALHEGNSLGSFVEEVAARHSGDREEILTVLSQLRKLGYVDYATGLFSRDVTTRMESMILELHRWSRSDHFEVLGVERDASDRAVRDGMRRLSKLYHPDRLVGEHQRVTELGALLYSTVQEVFKEVETVERRTEYRGKLRALDGEDGSGADQNSARVSMAQATILVKQKRYADAAQLYRDATLHDPGNADAHMWLGWCRYLSEPARVQECVASLQHALELNSRLRDAYFYLGRVHLLEKDYQQARGFFVKANTAPLGQPDAAGHAASASELRLMDSRGLGLSAEEEAERAAASPDGSSSKGLFGRFRRG